MNCAWDQLLGILPPWIRHNVNQQDKQHCQEIRLRLDQPPLLRLGTGNRCIRGMVTEDDLRYVINAASRYSPWASESVQYGFLTAPGGHRIGICGDAVMKQGIFTGVREVTSLCIRVARDYPGLARDLRDVTGSVLILGAPGWGKTTLLRDLVRVRCECQNQVAVVDERGELFPKGIPRGGADVLSGCSKAQGILMLLKTMGPQVIAVDEITEPADAAALIQAAGCGTDLLATAHASDLQDFLDRPVYRALRERHLFQTIVILRRDQSWYLERRHHWN